MGGKELLLSLFLEENHEPLLQKVLDSFLLTHVQVFCIPHLHGPYQDFSQSHTCRLLYTNVYTTPALQPYEPYSYTNTIII